MLQRAAETVSGDDECNDPAVLLACALGSTGCPAKCTDEAQKAKEDGKNPYEGVQAGDLNVAVSTSSSTVSIPNDGVIKVAELDVKASENIQLQSIDVSRLGLSENSGIKVWIEKDGKRITSSSSFFGDSKANLTFNNNGYVVNGNETLDLVVSLSGVSQGSELQFKVSNVVASAKNITVSPDTTGTFRTTNYKATSISFVPLTNGDRNYNLSSDTTFSFGEFKLQNDSSASMEKDVLIKSITFKVEGSVENLSNMKLLRDGKEVSSKYTVDGKSVTFAVNDQLDSGKSATYKITAVPTAIEKSVGTAGTDGDEYTFSIKKTEDVIAEEIGSNATAYRVSVKGDLPSLGKTTIKGGNITLTRDSNFASTVNANWGYNDVVIAKGNIKVNQAVKFEQGIKLEKDTAANTNTPADVDLSKVIRRATLTIAGRTYQASKIEADGIIFDSEVYLAKGDNSLELQVSLVNAAQTVSYKTTATTDVIPVGATVTKENSATFTPALPTDKVTTAATTAAAAGVEYTLPVSKIGLKNIQGSSFLGGSYQNGDETKFEASKQVAGTIRISSLNIQEQKTSVKKTGPSEDLKIRAGNTDEKTILVGEISNGTDKTLEVNKFNIADAGSSTAGKTFGDIYVVLGDDGSTSSTQTISKTQSASIDSISTTIEPGKAVKFEVRIIPDANLADTNEFQFNVSVEGKLEGNTTTSSAIKTAKVTVTDSANATVVAQTTKNRVVLPGTDAEVASFNYNVKNDSVDLSKVVFTTNNLVNMTNNALDSIDNVRIEFVGKKNSYTPSLSYTYTKTDITINFDNVLTLPEDSYTVKLYVTFNNSAVEAYNSTTAKAVEISKVAMGEAAAVSIGTYSHYVAKAYPLISVKDKNTSKDNERLDLNARKADKNESNVVRLTAIAGVGAFSVVEGSEEALGTPGIALSTDSVVVLRSRTAGEQVSTISFTVTDDDSNTVTYATLKSSDIADFASLSL